MPTVRPLFKLEYAEHAASVVPSKLHPRFAVLKLLACLYQAAGTRCYVLGGGLRPLEAEGVVSLGEDEGEIKGQVATGCRLRRTEYRVCCLEIVLEKECQRLLAFHHEGESTQPRTLVMMLPRTSSHDFVE